MQGCQLLTSSFEAYMVYNCSPVTLTISHCSYNPVYSAFFGWTLPSPIAYIKPVYSITCIIGITGMCNIPFDILWHNQWETTKISGTEIMSPIFRKIILCTMCKDCIMRTDDDDDV